MEKKPLNEGTTRGLIKDGVSKPTTTELARPSSPPPAPKPQQSVQKK